MGKYKNTQEANKALLRRLLDIQHELQKLAIFALQMSKNGDLSYANLLIKSRLDDELIEWAGMLISWFEEHGKLKWSIKKHKLVNSTSGKWAIEVAKKTPWSESPELAYELLDEIIDHEKQAKKQSILIYEAKEKELKESSAAIQKYLVNHPLSENPIGKLGLPADKNRWDKYKLKIKRK